MLNAFHTVTKTTFIIYRFLDFNQIRQMDYISAETQFLWQLQIIA